MPNLDRLKKILSIPEYEKDANITVSTKTEDDGTTYPSDLNFANADGSFKNSYRFMSTAMANEQLKTALMKPVKWGVEVTPSEQSIQKLKFQSKVHNDVASFSTKVENGDLKIYFGDHSSHSGNFVFAKNCGGNLEKQLYWPVDVINNILSLPGTKTIRISDGNAAEISVDSGLIIYNYKLPARSK
jgi:hypothetical protein